MDFATKYMAAKGWTAGDGLGKNRHGRKDPVKVKYKFDLNGLGHDKAESDKYKWWERAFQSASDAIQVGKDNKIEKVEGKETIVSTSRPMSKSLNKALLYGSHFVKAGVMSGGKFTREENSSDSDSSSDSEDEATKGKIVEVSDEALFAACGGMTGHKGARHGINMTAKLARIKEQERLGLEKMKNMYKKAEDAAKEAEKQKEEAFNESLEKSAKKKKKARKFEEPEVIENIPAKRVKIDEENNEEEVEESEKPKKKKKKTKSKKENEEQMVEEVEAELEEVSLKKKKKKSKKNRVIENVEAEENDPEEESSEEPKKSKKKKKSKKHELETEVVQEVEEENDSSSSKKKKKKRKKKKAEE